MNKNIPMGLGFAAFSFFVLGCTSQEKSTAAKAPESVSAPASTAQIKTPEVDDEAAKMLTSARLVPVDQGGVKGFRIDTIEKDSAWALAGLKEGDVITKVGGKPSTGAGEMISLLRAMEISPTPKLEVVRAGKTVKIGSRITQK